MSAVTELTSLRMARAPRLDVLLDTDLGNDIDDVLAIKLLATLQRLGYLNLRGVMLSNGCRESLAYANALLTDCSLACPIGFNLAAPAGSADRYAYLERDFPQSPHRQLFDLTDPGECRRFLEAARADQLIMIGPATNIPLLRAADPMLPGRLSIYSMAGNLRYDVPEFNVLTDPHAFVALLDSSFRSVRVCDFSLGDMLFFDFCAIEALEQQRRESLLTRSYRSFRSEPYDRQLWDPCTVLACATRDDTIFRWSQAVIGVNVETSVTYLNPPAPAGGLACGSVEVASLQPSANLLVKLFLYELMLGLSYSPFTPTN